MATRTRHPGTSDHHAAMQAAYELGVARQQLIDRDTAPTPRGPGLLSSLWTAAVIIACVMIGLLLYERLPGHGTAAQPLPTANVTTPAPRPTREAPPVAQEPAQDYGIPAYNAAQDERATAFGTADAQEQQAPPAPTADEAAINAWLEAPVSTPTPLPEPGAPGFVESFEDAPQCSPFVGYLAGDPCIAILKGEE